MRSLVSLLLALVAAAELGACGGAGAPRPPGQGTLVLDNRTDEGQGPLTVEQFLFQGPADPSPRDLLSAPVPPGGVVILGVFPEGTYTGVAVIQSGFGITFNDIQIRADQPTTLEIVFGAP